MNKKRNLVGLATIATCLSMTTINTYEINAKNSDCGTEEECQTLIEQAKDEISEINKKTSKEEQNLNEVETSIEDLLIQIEETETKIKENTEALIAKKEEITKTEEQLKVLQEEIKDLKDVVSNRIKISYRLSRSNVLLSMISESTSIVDLIRNIQIINHFADQDSQQMELLKNKVTEQETLMTSLKEQQTQLLVIKEELETNQTQLEKDQAELEKKREETKKAIQELEQERMSAEEVIQIAQEQKAMLERLAAEQQRLAEEERLKQEQANDTNSSVSTPTPSIQQTTSNFIIPLQTGYVSCEFMGYTNHTGIDLGNSGNTSTPVLASAAGVVTRAGWHHAYGNHVMITHNINGQVITTVYAHMHTSPYVTVGDYVYQGQQLGTMGTTGNSTGPHLHFEIYEGYYNYPHAVNPRKYVYFPTRW